MGRGRINLGALLLGLACFSSPSAAQEAVPSGQPLVLWEVRWEPVEGQDMPQAVLRFIAPKIARDGGTVDAEAAQADLLWLCETHGLPLAGLAYAPTGSIVITLMDRPVIRGQTDTDATQYFGLYQLSDDRCIEEVF